MGAKRVDKDYVIAASSRHAAEHRVAMLGEQSRLPPPGPRQRPAAPPREHHRRIARELADTQSSKYRAQSILTFDADRVLRAPAHQHPRRAFRETSLGRARGEVIADGRLRIFA